MRKYKVFISAAQKELKEERRAVKNFILGDVLLSSAYDLANQGEYEKAIEELKKIISHDNLKDLL